MLRAQFPQLTGRAPAHGASDGAPVPGSLGNAVSAAKTFGLRPGIAPTADHVSQLTSDIVWMESQQVKLPDGSINTVLVPKVYLAHLGDGAVTGGGALVTGANVAVKTDESIVNQGGTIAGGDILLAAARDVRNESLATTQAYRSANTSSSYTSLARQAAITASGALQITAGRDLTDVAGLITSASASLAAGRDVTLNALATGSTYQAKVGADVQDNVTANHALSQVNTTGSLVVSAGRDVTMNGAHLAIGGEGALLAGRALTVASVMDQVKIDEHGDANARQYGKRAADN